MKNLSYGYISSLCIELHLIVKAGISLEDGLEMLADGDTTKDTKSVLNSVTEYMSEGDEIYEALRKTERFPDYMCQMIEIGTKTGYQEEVFKALSEYYESQDQINRSIRNAIAYPSILVVMLLLVVSILITQVLPIFGEVYSQLGRDMPTFAVAIMNFGQWLAAYWYIAIAILAVIVGFALVLVKMPNLRRTLFSSGKNQDSLSAKIAGARFAFALSMTMQSGLDTSESLVMAERLSDNPHMSKRIQKCRELIESGISFAAAVEQSDAFPPIYSRMLGVGVRTGTTDSVMSEIARRSEDAANADLDRIIGRIEPTLVVIMSIIIGAILLAVMLPLTGIMSAI
ncbi:MAG: type II secretion system F family protein [Oscillospiraceae bacterium]|jgi:type IV pilus assembly protein PilC|nr:type II secretion system F family protein [Oscillospiraceae bacterium]